MGPTAVKFCGPESPGSQHLRFPGPQRRGEDHHHPDAPWPDPHQTQAEVRIFGDAIYGGQKSGSAIRRQRLAALSRIGALVEDQPATLT